MLPLSFHRRLHLAILLLFCVGLSLAVLAGCREPGKELPSEESTKAQVKLPEYLGEQKELDLAEARTRKQVRSKRPVSPAMEAPEAASKLNLPEDLPVLPVEGFDSKPVNPANPGVRITMAGGEEIICELRPDRAFRTVQHFIKLVQSKYLNGQYFHRSDNMCIQGGNGALIGREPYPTTLELEISGLPFLRGSLGMARTDDPDSASSQFFICKAPAEHLNADYANFGQVLEGMDFVLSLPPRDNAADPTVAPLEEKAKMVAVEIVRFEGWQKAMGAEPAEPEEPSEEVDG